MSDDLTRDVEARLDAWLANRAPTEIPPAFADRIASIPRVPVSAARPRVVRIATKRSSSGLLAAAVVAIGLGIVASGLFFAASEREHAVTVTVAPSASASGTPAPSAAASALAVATPPPTSIAVWPSDFRSTGILPATLADGIDHGLIDTPIGRARWVHLQGDAKTLPDPLVPTLLADGRLAWFDNGWPADACLNDPSSGTCDEPSPATLSISTDALAPRESSPLPVDAEEANFWSTGDTFWLTVADPESVWSSPDLEAWQETDLTGLRSPGPASIRWNRSASPSESIDGRAVATVEYTAVDPGSLLGYPGIEIHLVKEGDGFLVREHHSRSEGGDKDLAPVSVRETADGIAFDDGDGREVGRVDGVGPEFADMWAERGLMYYQLAVLDGNTWSSIDLPGAPIDGWPMVVKVADRFLALVVEPDQRVRVWRSVDGSTWTGGAVLEDQDGTAMRSNGVTYRDEPGGRVLVVMGTDDVSGWESTDGDRWAPVTLDPNAPQPPTQMTHGAMRTGDQTADGSWQVSRDGETWEPVPALREVILKTAPAGAGGSSESAVGDTVFFSVDEAEAPSTRDLWIIEFEQPAG